MKKTLLGALVVVTAAFFSIACQAAKADIVFDVAVDVANESEVLTAGITHAAVNAAEDTQAMLHSMAWFFSLVTSTTQLISLQQDLHQTTRLILIQMV